MTVKKLIWVDPKYGVNPYFWFYVRNEPKKRAHASGFHLSAFGVSGSARFGAHLRAKALFWATEGSALTWMDADLTTPITRHKHHQSPPKCTVHYPCSINQRIGGLKFELPAATPNRDCFPQS